MIKNLYLMGMALALSGCIEIYSGDMKCGWDNNYFQERVECANSSNKLPHKSMMKYNKDYQSSKNYRAACTSKAIQLIQEDKISDDDAWELFMSNFFRGYKNGKTTCSEQEFLDYLKEKRERIEKENLIRMEKNTIWRN